MWRVFAISLLVACGGDDAPLDSPVDQSTATSDLVGLVPLTLGSAYVRATGSQGFAFVERSDGDWVEGATYVGGVQYGMRLLDDPFDDAPICVVTGAEGESSIVRTSACQLVAAPSTTELLISCWDQEAVTGFDTHFTLACAGRRSGTETHVASPSSRGLRLGGAVISTTGFVIEPELGEFVTSVSQVTAGEPSMQETVVRAGLVDGMFDDAPNCVANGTVTSSVEIARLARDAIEIEPNDTVPAFHTLCVGERGLSGRVTTSSERGGLLVGASVTSAGMTTELGEWITNVTSPGTGQLAISVMPDVLPGDPICTCSSVGASRSRCAIESATRTSILLRTLGDNGAAVAADAQLLCVAEQ